jgi:H+/Cl- antiporter ClcA
MRSGLSKRTILNDRDLLLAGGAAGIAAAFNAPLAGIVFAIEELSKRFEQRTSGLIVTGIVLAGLVAVAMQGNFTYFGRLHVDVLSPALLIPGAACALIAGLLGGFFSRLLIQSTIGTADWASHLRQSRPLLFAGGCGLAIAILGVVSGGAAHGSGYQYTKDVLNGGEHMPMFYVGIKLLATWLSYWSGVPGGIFAPSLAIGAGIGNDIALLTQSVSPQAIVAIGMVGFLAAVTQAPITSFIIVMEMIDGHAMVLSLMATALTSSAIARLISPSLYHSLALIMKQKLEAPIAS